MLTGGIYEKKVKVAINGFGRIGRQVAKIIMDDKSGLLDLVAINDLYDSKMNAHLFKYDSSYGKCSCEVVVDENDDLIVDGHWIDVLQERDPSNLPGKILALIWSSNPRAFLPPRAVMRKLAKQARTRTSKLVQRKSSSPRQPKAKISPS